MIIQINLVKILSAKKIEDKEPNTGNRSKKSDNKLFARFIYSQERFIDEHGRFRYNTTIFGHVL